MAYEFKLPDLGEGLTEGEIARWLVAEGDEVDEDQPLVEIQTDKTTVEIPSPSAGTVLQILVAEGDVAPVGAVIVVIGDAGEQLLRAVDGGQQAAEPASEPVVAVVPADPVAAVRATPVVRQLAQELGVELVGLGGSGPGGRIVEDDVRAASRSATAATQDGRRVPVRGIRRAIVEQVTRTHREIPAVTFVEECDFTGVDLGLLVPLAIHAAAGALARFPELNARLEGDEIVLLDRYDVGRRGPDRRRAGRPRRARLRATLRRRDRRRGATARGRGARGIAHRGGASRLDVHRHERRQARRARRHPADQPSRGRDPRAPPDRDRAVVRDGEIVVRKIGNVSVTFDHRVVDGARAAAFCLDVIERLRSAGASPA